MAQPGPWWSWAAILMKGSAWLGWTESWAARTLAVTPLRIARFDRYNIVSEDDLRATMQEITLYVDTLPTTRKEPGEFSESQPR